jgi:hypothetical protein
LRKSIEYFGRLVSQGVVYGDYYLLGRLAMGGMAEVFLAKTLLGENADDLLALKRTLPQFSNQPDFVSMFTDEARIAHRLRHPHICQIFDQGEHNDQLYIVMEFIHGKDLKIMQHRSQQRSEPMPARFVAFVLARIAQALDFAHHKENEKGEPENIVHRDISPQNILLSYDGIPKLIDFGIAKAKDRIAKTRVGIVKGKFAYMSPEQAIGGEVDFRTDIFAMGVVLYELICGQLPFKGASDFSTLKRIAKAEYTPPQEITPDIPPRIVKIIEKCLARDREARYARAADLAADLDRYLVDEGGRAVNEAALSSFMRKLFRDDYIREMARIREFKAIEPPAATRARAKARQLDVTDPAHSMPPAPMPEGDTHDDLPVDESTVVAATMDLAAGFNAEVTGLSELLGRDETEVGTPRPRTNTNTQTVTDPEFEQTTDEVKAPQKSEFEEQTREVSSMHVEHLIRQLKDEARSQTSVTQQTADLHDEKTREVSAALVLGRAAVDAANRQVEVDTGFTTDTTDEIQLPPRVGEQPLDLVEHTDEVPKTLDDEVTGEEVELSQEEVEIGDLEVDESSLPESPPKGGWKDAGNHEVAVAADVRAAASPQRPVLLTSGEKKILWLAAALGACIVAGSYWWAAHGPQPGPPKPAEVQATRDG